MSLELASELFRMVFITPVLMTVGLSMLVELFKSTAK